MTVTIDNTPLLPRFLPNKIYGRPIGRASIPPNVHVIKHNVNGRLFLQYNKYDMGPMWIEYTDNIQDTEKTLRDDGGKRKRTRKNKKRGATRRQRIKH